MLLEILRQNKYFFFRDRKVTVSEKTDKNDNYIGIEIVHKTYGLFKTKKKYEMMYKQVIPLKIHTSEVVCNDGDGFVSIIVDGKQLNDKKEHYIDIYTYDLKERTIKCKRSKINLP